jgi:subtilisin family serine protease
MKNPTTPLDLVKLTPLMALCSGRPEVKIGLIDGPVATNHPELARERVRELAAQSSNTPSETNVLALQHGTFVAGVLCARRNSPAPAICPGCTLLTRPIFGAATASMKRMPTATPGELAQAIVDCIDAGARILNISAVLAQSAAKCKCALEEAVAYAVKRGVIVVAAAGNQGALGGSTITRHPWVVPVVAYDLQGRPTAYSNQGTSIGRRGIGAPGEGITSLGAAGKPVVLSGTSAAVPFVTGAIALLWSAFPASPASEVKHAATRAHAPRRTTVAPPLLDAWSAYRKRLINRPC